MSRIPLEKYLTTKIQNLKVHMFNAVPSSTPIEINIEVFTEKYGYNNLYDRFRFWTTMEALEENVEMEEDMRLSNHIPPRLFIRRMNVKEDWMLSCVIWFEGSIEIRCNDSDLARNFYDEVLVSRIRPPTTDQLPPPKVTSRWTNETPILTQYLAYLTGGLSWFFSEKGNESRYKELFSAYKQSLKALRGRSLVGVR